MCPTDPPDPDPPSPLTTTTGAGATPGALSVDHSGVAHYSVAIEVPPGRGGMQPSLALEYSSVGADGWLGRGWSLAGTSAITRCARSVVIDGFRGSVRYDEGDAFCLDGSRLVLFAGKEGEEGAEYRTERESFVRDTQMFVRYDAEQNRAVTEGSGGRHVYFGDFEQRDALEVAHVVAHGRRVAQIRTDLSSGSTDVQYLHGDDLGSIDASTDESGEVIARHAYSPFGRRLERDWTFDSTDTELGFTEHEHDDEVGLIHMRGRMYDPQMRRFTSPDPFVPVANSPQAHNRYSYVFNRPATLTDPSGYQPVPLPSPWVPYDFIDAHELDQEPEEPSTNDGPDAGNAGSTPATPAGQGQASPAPTPASTTGITLVIVSNDESPSGLRNTPQRELWRLHARQIQPGSTIQANFTSVREATDYINNLPAGTQIRNLVGLGHGAGSSDEGSGQFAIQSTIALRTAGLPAASPADLLGAPRDNASADTTAFWNAVAARLVDDGQARVQFLACYIGRDPDFASTVQQFLDRGSNATIAVDTFRDFYAVAARSGEGGIETFSKEVPSEPTSPANAQALGRAVVRQGVPASVGHARPSVSYP